MHRLIRLIQNNSLTMQHLHEVAKLNLPDCFIAAGYLRNMVWDHLHSFAQSKSEDIDVIYFDRDDSQNVLAKSAQKKLELSFPNLSWDVKNQANMHIRNSDQPYHNSSHAMSFWPEIETAVAAKIENDKIIIATPFGVDTLFAGKITHNPNRKIEIFQQRLADKKWLQRWPNLVVMY